MINESFIWIGADFLLIIINSVMGQIALNMKNYLMLLMSIIGTVCLLAAILLEAGLVII